MMVEVDPKAKFEREGIALKLLVCKVGGEYFAGKRGRNSAHQHVMLNGYRVTAKMIYDLAGAEKRILWHVDFPKPGKGGADTNDMDHLIAWIAPDYKAPPPAAPAWGMGI